MPQGKVKRLVADRGFGFIKEDDGDLFFHRSEVRARVASELRGKLNGAQRVGMPAVLGLEEHTKVWQEFQDRLGVPVFEIPTLPPSVPGLLTVTSLVIEPFTSSFPLTIVVVPM